MDAAEIAEFIQLTFAAKIVETIQLTLAIDVTAEIAERIHFAVNLLEHLEMFMYRYVNKVGNC